MRIFVYEYLSGGGRVAGDASAGATLLPLGASMRDAIAADLLRSGLCELTVAAGAAAPAVPAGAREVRAAPGESPFDFVSRMAGAHDGAWVVAPETGGLLARLQHGVDPLRWIGCEPAAIALAGSKRATLACLWKHGIATPLDFERAGDAVAWVVKPDDGAGSVDTRRHARHHAALVDAAQRLAEGRSATVEPFVEGEPLSLSLACGPEGATLLSINRQCILHRATGRLSFEGLELDAWPLAGERGGVLQALAQRVTLAIPGLRGFAGIDVVWHPVRGPVVIEVNPRVTCALVGLSAALGRNVGGELLRAWQAERLASHV